MLKIVKIMQGTLGLEKSYYLNQTSEKNQKVNNDLAGFFYLLRYYQFSKSLGIYTVYRSNNCIFGILSE